MSKIDDQQFSGTLPEKAKYWRTKKNDFNLHQAKAILKLSIGYISDLENGKEKFNERIFMKYHRADAALFPLSDANIMI